MSQIIFADQMTGEEYNELRRLVGFNMLSQRQAQRGLEHTTFLVAARDEGKIVGTRIVKSLMEKTMDAAFEGDRIMFVLGAAKGKEGFYEKLGFLKRPNEVSGCGMSVSMIKTANRQGKYT